MLSTDGTLVAQARQFEDSAFVPGLCVRFSCSSREFGVICGTFREEERLHAIEVSEHSLAIRLEILRFSWAYFLFAHAGNAPERRSFGCASGQEGRGGRKTFYANLVAVGEAACDTLSQNGTKVLFPASLDPESL
jgi:hypothetical protein